MLSYKQIPFELRELKADDGQMQFSGLASTYGNLDHSGDVVVRGCFDETLKSGVKRRLLWQHNMSEPIGVEVKLESTDQGLFGTWKLSKTTRGLDCYELLKDGAVDSLSIGYIPDDFEYDDAGVRLLKSVTLLETSVVSIPANDQAVITNVKADVPFSVLLKQLADGLGLGLKEAEALWARRLQDGREPTEAHIEAVKQLLAQVEAAATGLTPLIKPLSLFTPEAKAQPEGAEASAGDGDASETPVEIISDVSLRLANKAHRYRALGILERAS